MGVVGLTHDINRFIVSYTGRLSSSGFFPATPWSSAWQISAQDNPSSTQSCSSIIKSYRLDVKLEQIVAEWQETYPYRCKKSVDRAKNGLGWCDTRGFLHEFQGFDGRVQCRDSILSPLGSLRLGIHGRNSGRLRENGAAWKLWGRT